MADGANEDFGRSVAKAIEETLNREARRNEQTIAAVRAATMLGLLGIEAWLVTGGSVLGSAVYPLAALSVVYFLGSMALWLALSRGWWNPIVQWIAPTGDALFYATRQGVTLWLVGIEGFIIDQDLATAMGFGCLLILSSAFRLSGRLVLYAAGLALATYLFFAVSIRLERFFITLQVIFLMATMLASYGLTKQVLRAVQGEVRRLTVARLLPAPVLEQADEDPVALLSQPRSLRATVVITDIRGFTAWAEDKAPLQVLGFLNRVQGGLADIVQAHGGTVDKFMGDGMLAVFGAPVAMADHADRAVAAVEEMLRFVGTIEAVELGVGVHSGELVVGCLGSGVRMEFTILGDTVNTASRLEAKTKEVGVPVLISQTTEAACNRGLEKLQQVEIRGKQQVLWVYGLPPSNESGTEASST